MSAPDDWFERVPKIELHLHLEGAIPVEALFELMKKYGGDPIVKTREDLARKFQYTDFAHFIQAWLWKNRFLREYDDFEFIAEHVARDLLAQNIRYVEAHYSPPDHTRKSKLETAPLTEAFRRGLDKVKGIEIKLIADVVRDYGAASALRTVEEVAELNMLGVIGIGLGGSEKEYPPEAFEQAFARARALGLHTTAHAGEVAGPESVWGAVKSLRAERVGHGTRAADDERLVAYLAESGIAIEMCPLSNLRTGSVSSIAEHPIRRFFDEGLLVTVSTDDPKMFNNSLHEEYRLLESQFGFTHDEIRRVILNGIEASWLPQERKHQLETSFVSDKNWR